MLREHCQILIQTSDQFDRLLERELVGGYRRDFVYHGTVGVGLGQQLPIRICLYVRPQIMDLGEFAHCIFQMNIISGQILVDHAVDIVPRTREGYEFHFYNHTYPPMLTSYKCYDKVAKNRLRIVPCLRTPAIPLFRTLTHASVFY